MTGSNPSKKSPAEILPPIPLPPPSFPSPYRVGTQLQSPQGPSVKDKNNLFLSLLLQIGRSQDVHFHALCLLQLFKMSLYARKHKLIHKAIGNFAQQL